MISAMSNQPADSLAQLLALHDQTFVRCAYLTLLGRAADPDGLRTYTRQVRLGERKMAIVSQLHRSAEGRAFAADLPGLSKAVTAYRQSRWPVLGRLFQLGKAAEGDGAHERRLRGIENAVHANAAAILDKLDRIDAMVLSRATAPAVPSPSAPLAAQEQATKVVSPASVKPAKGGFVPA